MRRAADQVSAYGQEPWAQQALAALRRGWPDWAFLVVRYRWLALRGKQVVISATGPQELRYALPPISPVPDPAKPVPESGLPVSGLVEPGVFESGPAVPTLAELLNGVLGVSWTRAGVAGGDDGAGAG